MSKYQPSEEGKKQLKSPEQGAATTVWAAMGKEWEGKGGKYLDDCAVSEPVDPTIQNLTPAHPGYKAYIYDQEASEKLWAISEQMVGISDSPKL